MTTANTLPAYTGGDDAARFVTAEQHRAGLKFKGAPRDTMVRITRYKNGAVLEVIEKRIKTDERIRKGRKARKTIANFPSKTMRTHAKQAKVKRMKRDAKRLIDSEPELYVAGPKAARAPFDVEEAYGFDVDGPEPFNFNLTR